MQQSSIRQQRPVSLVFVLIGLVVSTVLLALLVRDVIQAPLLAQALTWGVFWFSGLGLLRVLGVGHHVCQGIAVMGVGVFGWVLRWKHRDRRLRHRWQALRQAPQRLLMQIRARIATWFAGRMWALDHRGAWRIGRPGDRRHLVVRVSVFGQVSPGDLGHIESL